MAMDLDAATLTAVGTAAAVCGGAVKILWARVTEQSKATEQALQECRDEHKQNSKKMDVIHSTVVQLSGEVGQLRGRIEGYQEAQKTMGRRQDDMQDQMDHEKE